MRQLQEVIRKIEETDIGCRRPISTKSGWLKLQEDVSLVQALVPTIISELERLTSERKSIPDFKRNTKPFTIVQKAGRIWPWRTEDALERCIVVSSPGIGLYNQISVDEGRESIDLAIQNAQHEWTDLIELKPWDNGDNPLFALTEIVKNYLFLKAIPGEKFSETKIVVAAPGDYFKSYEVDFAPGSLLPELCKTFANKLGIRVSVLSNTLTEQEFLDEVQKRIDAAKWQPPQNPTEQYVKQQEMEPFRLDQLAFNNWKLLC